MRGPLSQRDHPLAAEFPVLKAWTAQAALIYHADLLHRSTEGAFNPRAHKLSYGIERTGLWENDSEVLIYRVWVRLNDGAGYRAEWRREHDLGTLWDVWVRVPWSVRHKASSRSATARRAREVARRRTKRL